jgi:hypothetical protein
MNYAIGAGVLVGYVVVAAITWGALPRELRDDDSPEVMLGVLATLFWPMALVTVVAERVFRWPVQVGIRLGERLRQQRIPKATARERAP